MRARLQELKLQLRHRMHDSVVQTGCWLRSIVQGYFNCYAVPGNLNRPSVFRERSLQALADDVDPSESETPPVVDTDWQVG